VTVRVSGHGPTAVCCQMLSQIHTWGHSLVIFRDHDRVWEGPITRLNYRRAEVQIDALDMLGWTTRRVVHNRHPNAAQPIVDEGRWSLDTAFSEDAPNVLITNHPASDTSLTVRRDTDAGSGYYDEDLTALCDAGLYVTCVGRRIHLWAEPDTLAVLAPMLMPGEHLVEDVDIVEDGLELSTRSTGRNDKGKRGSNGTIDGYYGLVERIVDASSLADNADMDKAARRDRAKRFPAPLRIIVPDNATLNCDAPFQIADLVAGVTINVGSAVTCRRVQQSMTLTQVDVTEGGEQPEQVKITLQPIGNAQIVTQDEPLAEAVPEPEPVGV